MNKKAIVKIIGFILCFEALFMLPSTIIAATARQYDLFAFIIVPVGMFAIGIPCTLIKPANKNFYTKDGFMTVALSWLLMSFFGALPYYISGAIPSFMNSFFETVSGFTTTGATILSEIESLPKATLFWRNMTHWIGGMGVLVLTLAIIPSFGGRGVHLLNAETTGISGTKLVPSLRKTALILYGIYTALTLILVLCLLLAGMNVFDSFLHAMSTAGTGGFSNRNISIGAYNSPVIEIILTVFMYLFGINFSIYFVILTKGFAKALRSEELRLYTIILGSAMLLIALNLMKTYGGNFFTALRYSSFQAASVMSTTGFSSTDFNLWPTFSKTILLLLIALGSCASSTAGGIKIVRILVMFKAARVELKKTTHPNIVKSVTLDGRAIDNTVLHNVWVFFLLYVTTIVSGTILISINGFDFTTTFSSVLTTVSNAGPGLNLVGPLGNYSAFSSFSKIVFSFCMLIGRLEIFPVLFLFIPKKVFRSNDMKRKKRIFSTDKS